MIKMRKKVCGKVLFLYLFKVVILSLSYNNNIINIEKEKLYFSVIICYKKAIKHYKKILVIQY